MELRNLEYFITVADTKNVSKAAEALFITQPALSRAISSLEAELGAPLFERRNRKMVLTNYGQGFYHRISRVLKDLDLAVAEVRRASGQTSSILTISSLMPEFFTPIASIYQKKRPDIVLRAFNNTVRSAKEALVYGDINFCLTPVAFDHPSLVWFSLCEEEMLLIAPYSVKLESKDGRVALHTLENQPFISTPGGSNLHQCTTSFCKTAGFDPNIVVETPSIDTISMLVSDGIGVAFVSETVHNRMSAPRMNPARPPYRAYRIVSPDCFRNVGIAMRKNQSLSDIEYEFLLQLLFFFQPELESSPELLKNHIFVQYLNAHYFVPAPVE